MTSATAAHKQPQEYRQATAKDWLALVVLAFAVLLIAVDGTVLDIAIPFVSASLAPSSVELLWIIDVYSFVLAGLLVTMGTLGDRIGRRRLLMIGAIGFGTASVLAAFATDPAMLIAARALQGVAGATLMPATLALIRTTFADPRQRTTAIGVWSAMAGGGAAGGPVLGGWLLEHFWWGSVFLINVPIMLVLVLVGPMVIPESRDPNPGRFDLVSAGLSITAMVPAVFVIKELALYGPSPTLLGIGAVGLISGFAFVRRQSRLAHPMIELDLFAERRFTTAVLTNLLSIFALTGVLFFGAQYLQGVLGVGALEAGLLLVPGTAMSIVSSLGAGTFVRWYAPRTVLMWGLLIAAVGALLLVGLRSEGGPALFIVGFALVGFGAGLALTLSADLVVGSVPSARAGSASAVSETAYELGIASGVAILGSLVMAMYRSGIEVGAVPESVATQARETLGGAVSAAQVLPEAEAQALLRSAKTAFVEGMHVASIVTAVVMTLTAALVMRLLSDRTQVASTTKE